MIKFNEMFKIRAWFGVLLSSFKMMSKLERQVVEQSLHFIAGAAIALLTAMLIKFGFMTIGIFDYSIWPKWVGVSLSIFLGILREALQWPIRRWWDTVLDLVFWILGAFIGVLWI